MRRWLWGAVGVLVGGSSVGAARAQAPTLPAEVHLVPGPSGALGAWLVSGPFDRGRLVDEEHLAPRLGAGWRLVSASDGPVDLATALDAKSGDHHAYAGGVLHIEHGGRHTLLLGASDGVSVIVDGKRVFVRDEGRPQRDDDDLVPLDLAAGDHTVVVGLHQHKGGPWSFRARLLDAQLQPPEGSSWTLPGTTPDDARALASRMSSISLD
jgi:hypothetical protein